MDLSGIRLRGVRACSGLQGCWPPARTIRPDLAQARASADATRKRRGGGFVRDSLTWCPSLLGPAGLLAPGPDHPARLSASPRERGRHEEEVRRDGRMRPLLLSFCSAGTDHSTFSVGILLAQVTARTGILVLIQTFCSLKSFAVTTSQASPMVCTGMRRPFGVELNS